MPGADAHSGLPPEPDAEPRRLIHFFSEEVEFEPADPDPVRSWILDTVRHEGLDLDEVSFVFCSDAYLLGINQQFLMHDEYTDIVTFPYREEGRVVTGDVYISVERVEENAESLGIGFPDELHRVIIHGILHLLGYMDATDKDKAFMRQKEDFYLRRRSDILRKARSR